MTEVTFRKRMAVILLRTAEGCLDKSAAAEAAGDHERAALFIERSKNASAWAASIVRKDPKTQP